MKSRRFRLRMAVDVGSIERGRAGLSEGIGSPRLWKPGGEMPKKLSRFTSELRPSVAHLENPQGRSQMTEPRVTHTPEGPLPTPCCAANRFCSPASAF